MDNKAFQITLEDYKANHLAKQLLEEVYKKKWFRLFLPKDIGGSQLSLHEGINILRDSARIFGSLGWVINLGAGAGYFYAFYNAETARELFQPREAVIAGSGSLGGTAVKVNNGYILNGIWSKCSGSEHATLFTVNATGENDEVLSFTLTADQVQFTNDCQMFGLKATSSQSIVVKDALVPDNYVFKIGSVKYFSDYKLYNLSFDQFARFCMGSTFIGITYCFLDSVEKDIATKGPQLISTIDELQNELKVFDQKIIELAKVYWNKANESSSVLIMETDELACLIEASCRRIFLKVCQVYYNGGSRLSNESELAHWAFRDVLTASQHFLLKGSSLYRNNQ